MLRTSKQKLLDPALFMETCSDFFRLIYLQKVALHASKHFCHVNTAFYYKNWIKMNRPMNGPLRNDIVTSETLSSEKINS